MPTDLDTINLALILTAAGATVGAALITGIIGILKKLGGLGAWIDASREPIVAFVLSALLVIGAYGSTLTQLGGTETISVQGAFAAFLAWYGIAQISMGVHNTVQRVSSSTP